MASVCRLPAGGIDNNGTLTLANMTISGNSGNGTGTTSPFTGFGGGVFNAAGTTMTISNSTISNNYQAKRARDRQYGRADGDEHSHLQ